VSADAGRVLLVDDDQALCEALEMGLRGRGFSVTWRTSADLALRLVESEDFDVTLTDLNMRGTNGIELCHRVIAAKPDMPVVLLTGFGSLDAAVAAMRAGAFDFLSKPVKLDVLAIALERAVDHRRQGAAREKDPSELAPLEEVERRYILRVLEAVGGNKSVAARVLGIERKTLYRKLERFGAREG
jgi:DNA-binding NtrC family response regulator